MFNVVNNKELMSLDLEINDKDEVFTHQDDDGTIRHFPAGAMFRFAEKHAITTSMIRCVKVAITQNQVDFIRKNMGIEQERLDRLVEPYLSQPAVAILWGGDRGGSVTYIDGNHRIVKLWENGIKEIKTYIYVRQLWEQTLVTLRPEHAENAERYLTQPSGMIEFEKSQRKH